MAVEVRGHEKKKSGNFLLSGGQIFFLSSSSFLMSFSFLRSSLFLRSSSIEGRIPSKVVKLSSGSTRCALD